MLKRVLNDLVDFFQMFFNPQAVYERHHRTPRGLDAPKEDWSYRR